MASAFYSIVAYFSPDVLVPKPDEKHTLLEMRNNSSSGTTERLLGMSLRVKLRYCRLSIRKEKTVRLSFHVDLTSSLQAPTLKSSILETNEPTMAKLD